MYAHFDIYFGCELRACIYTVENIETFHGRKIPGRSTRGFLSPAYHHQVTIATPGYLAMVYNINVESHSNSLMESHYNKKKKIK